MKLTLKASGGLVRDLRLNDIQVTAITCLELIMDAQKFPEAIIHLDLIEVDAEVDPVKVIVPDWTKELLEQLGWKAPDAHSGT